MNPTSRSLTGQGTLPVTPDEAAARIPHAAPIRCLGRVLEASDQGALSRFTVEPDALFLDGDTYRAEGLIEGMAQCVGAMEATTRDPRSSLGMLVAIKNMHVHELPSLGDTIEFRASLTRRLGPFTLAQCTADCGGTRLADGEFKFFIEGA